MLLQVLDAFQHAKNKLNFLVSIGLDGIVLEASLVFGELRNDFTEARLCNPSESIVVVRGDCGTPLALVDEGDLTKVITPVKDPHLLLSAIVVTNLDLAVAGANEVHAELILIGIVLLDNIIVRQLECCAQSQHNCLKEELSSLLGILLHGGLCSRLHRDARLEHALSTWVLGLDDHHLRLLDYLVCLHEQFLEHVAANALRQTRRDVIHELFKLFLLLHRLHDSFKVFTDVGPQRLWQVDVLHGRVTCVNDFLTRL